MYTLKEVRENGIDLTKLTKRELDCIITSFCLGHKGLKSDKIRLINNKLINKQKRYGRFIGEDL